MAQDSVSNSKLLSSELANLIYILKKGQFDEVNQIASILIKKHPNSIQLLKILGISHSQKKNYSDAINFFNQALKLNPADSDLLYNLGVAYQLNEDFLEAKKFYKKAQQLKPKNLNILNNLGIVEREMGEFNAAAETIQSAIALKPNFAPHYNTLGNIKNDVGEKQIALELYSKALSHDTDFYEAAYNIHSLQNTTAMAIEWLERCLSLNENYFPAEFMYAALNDFEGHGSFFDDLISKYGNTHPYIRSYNWIKGLSNKPKIFHNKWDFFDGIARFCVSDRPFYEYGVWTGNSFRYLLTLFNTGFGFDTFVGLPENWHDKKTGTYSNFGKIPKIERGELIVGKFEETLPTFYAKKRDLACLINFDCDLYSSTICALNWSKPIIDKDTILVFDEFIMNEFWEKDEFKAFLDFCDSTKAPLKL